MPHYRTLTYLPVLTSIVIGTVAVSTQPQVLAITGVSVVDIIDGRIVPNSTVVVTGDTITSVTPNGAPPSDARVIDGRDKFLIPGLWDMHAHIQGSEKGGLPLYVANGVTGIRDMGADLDFILEIRSAVSSRRILGPRVVAAGPILDDAPGDWPQRIRVKTPEEGRAAVQLLKKRGVDLIKVHNFTPRDVFFAIADEARRQNLPLAGHVPLKVTVQEAIDAGLGNIEHLSEDGRVWKWCSGGAEYRAEACRPFYEMLARRQVWQTPTLLTLSENGVMGAPGAPGSDVSTEEVAYANKNVRDIWAGTESFLSAKPEIVKILKGQAEIAKLVTSEMAKAGVGILAGCDVLVAGFCAHGELATMVQGGMTPLAALQTATVNPARYLGRDNILGTVETGKIADLVLLDANPLEDIANVRRIRAVVVAGRFLDRNELDQLLAQARAAAQQ